MSARIPYKKISTVQKCVETSEYVANLWLRWSWIIHESFPFIPQFPSNSSIYKYIGPESGNEHFSKSRSSVTRLLEWTCWKEVTTRVRNISTFEVEKSTDFDFDFFFGTFSTFFLLIQLTSLTISEDLIKIIAYRL